VIISRYKFAQCFQEQFKTAEARLLNDLDGQTKVSLALDAWSAANHVGFLAIKGYYINSKWQLRERLLDFRPMRGRHTGESMAREVHEVLASTNTTKKLLAITCDNASSNKALTQNVEESLGSASIQWSAQENTIPCLAHIINLVVQDIITHLHLAASDADDNARVFQREHVNKISTSISLPNSLRKVRSPSSQYLITY